MQEAGQTAEPASRKPAAAGGSSAVRSRGGARPGSARVRTTGAYRQPSHCETFAEVAFLPSVVTIDWCAACMLPNRRLRFDNVALPGAACQAQQAMAGGSGTTQDSDVLTI